MDETTDDLAYRRACESLAPWEERLRTPTPSTPETGSRLSADDTAVHGMPTSELAHLALITGTESLQLVRETLEKTDKYIVALNGPIRTGILAGAHAVWLVHPANNDAERITRQLWAHHEFHTRFGQYLGALPSRAALADGLAHEKRRRDEYARLLGKTSKMRRTSDTEVIKWASEYVLSSSNATVVQSHWQLLSGDAHALGWPLMMHPNRTTESIVDGIITGVAGPDTTRTKDLFQTAAAMITAGWREFIAARKP